jgi:hypothetical protein
MKYNISVTGCASLFSCEISRILAGRTLPPGRFSGTNSYYRLSTPRLVQLEEFGKLKKIQRPH